MTAFTLRMSPSLHACIQEMAKRDRRSMQMWIQRTLEASLPKGLMAEATLKELQHKTKKRERAHGA